MPRKPKPTPASEPKPKIIGRPLEGATKMITQPISMSGEDLEIARKLGEGVISKGVRVALRRAGGG